jgi:8-oxo-dGTP pyrophosphatase MutT (NUDIX family)
MPGWKPAIDGNAVRAALALPAFDVEAAWQAMIPGSRQRFPQPTEPPRQAGVLVLLYPLMDELHIVLTRRTDTLRGHSGQVSFPGGKYDPHDGSLVETARRETCEELGICGDDLDMIGHLSTVYIPPSNFEVYPSVALLPGVPDFSPNPAEVAEVFSVPLAALLDHSYKSSEYRDFQGTSYLIPYYHFNGHKVWGATAIMLSELEGRLRAVLPV